MARTDHLVAEIEALRGELARVAARTADGPRPETAAAPAEDDRPGSRDVRATLEELRERLARGVEDAETAATDHPVATAAAAFLLGVIVGRLWRGA